MGSQNTSVNGVIWEEFARELGLIVLNDGSPTLLNTRNTLTSVDVSMTSAGIDPRLNRMTLCLPETADNFPIIINNSGTIYRKRFQPKF